MRRKMLLSQNSDRRVIAFNSFLGCDVNVFRHSSRRHFDLSIPFWDATYNMYKQRVKELDRTFNSFLGCDCSIFFLPSGLRTLPFNSFLGCDAVRVRIGHTTRDKGLSIPFWDATLTQRRQKPGCST